MSLGLPAAPSPAAAGQGVLERTRRFLFQRWLGRILVGALALYLLDLLGGPVPAPLEATARLVLFLFAAWGLVRLGRVLLRRLMWRIRTKLILSYLFIAVVPLVLLALLFLLAALLFSGLVASHVVSAEVDRTTSELRSVARAALWKLPGDDGGAAAAVKERMAAGREIHPDASFALVRRGKVLVSSGEAPSPGPPTWWSGPGFAGVVKKGEGQLLRGAWREGDAYLTVDAPMDSRLFGDVEQRAGIRIIATARPRKGRARRHEDAEVDFDVDEPRTAKERISGFPFVATLEKTDWSTGKTEVAPVVFQFRPWELVQRLSPGSINVADFLVKALAAAAALFLVVYCVALLLGFLLARSITRSVHALSVGTERLRQGDFSQPILIRSRDQLGELADSFNMMARGIQDLLREQTEKERLEEELRIARKIQMSLLPQGAVTLPGLQISALCLPAAEVGGDYYDLLPLTDSRMGVLVADVSGKGTSAALYMAELKGLVLSLSRMYDSPAKLLSEANRILAATLDPRSFITMTYAVVDTAARTMRHARAGHNPIIHLQANTGRTRVLAPQGLGLGIDAGDRFDEILEEAEVPLAPGDLFLLFTDGLSEAMNGQAELFGERRLRDILEGAGTLGCDELRDLILAEIRLFVGAAAQHDDMTFVLLKVT
jgi:phosphoserine phosphatase RsbU/P